MVLERYLTDVLSNRFGHFVEGLDKNQVRLSGALWKGQVSLENVRLRRHALDHFVPNNPVEIAHGHVGTLQFHIPWQVLLQLWQGTTEQRTSVNGKTKKKGGIAVSLVLKDVHILIVPRRTRRQEMESRNHTKKEDSGHPAEDSNPDEDDETESNDAQDPWLAKEHLVQAALDAELLRIAETVSASIKQTNKTVANNNKTKNNSSWQFWLQERLAAILENLTVTMQNIHVRYEDPGSSMGFVWTTDDLREMPKRYRPSFCVGLTLSEFTIHSIQQGGGAGDSKSQAQTPAPGTFSTLYKRAAATDLALYWNSDSPILAELAVKSGGDHASFYRQAFLAFQNGTVGEQSGMSEATRTALFGLFHSVDRNQTLDTFVLDPFSPSITFATVRQQPSANLTTINPTPTPPSSMEARLPPCRITVSRNLIEDLGYLRKSLGVWVQSRHYEQFRAVFQTRPTVSPLENPKAWWKYAFSAVLAIQRGDFTKQLKTQEQQKRTVPNKNGATTNLQSYSTSQKQHQSPDSSSPPEQSHHRGWRALAHAILHRHRYIHLYKQFLENDNDEDSHQQLMNMERMELSTDEIVAFRIYAASQIPHSIPSGKQQCLMPRRKQSTAGVPTSPTGDDVSVISVSTADTTTAHLASSKDLSTFDKDEEDDAHVLSTEHRYRMFIETKQALAEGARANPFGRLASACSEDDDDSSASNTSTTATNTTMPHRSRPFGLDNSKNRLSWTTHISCPEVSLQVNDKRIQRRHRDLPAPVVRLHFAFIKEQRLFFDGSWELAMSIGSLHVEDCTTNSAKNPFPNLLGPKQTDLSLPSDSFHLDGQSHIRSASLRIRRSQRGFRTNEFGSTTWTEIRVLPLEICYFTAPVEALVRILNIANLDFADDYQRLGVQIYEWRERQKKRLLAALSHHQKSIFVQVNVGAPTLLLPDEDNLLIVDLGQLTFCNEDSSKRQIQYDDHWRFELASIQVQCASVEKYKSLSSRATSPSPIADDAGLSVAKPQDTLQQLIEPFSLIFAISTKFQDNGGDRTDSILVRASLPRLAFNITTSAIRLVRRLREQWDERQQEIRSSLLLPSRVFGGLTRKLTASTTYVTRNVEFNFVAPLLRFRCENDVDGRDCNSSSRNTTPLVDLALRGIEGSWKSSILPSGQTKVMSEAKLRGVDCFDLYQGAGAEFSLLISSIAPESISFDRSSDRYLNSTDLVSINFESSSPASGQTGSCLKIQFHELFVEWNAETIAALHKAIKKPFQLELKETRDGTSDSERFFDAEEEDFQDAGSVQSKSSESSSEQSSHPSSSSELAVSSSSGSSFESGGLLFGRPLSPTQQWISGLSPLWQAPPSPPDPPQSNSFEIIFDLSKLRVNFNKESRHRRVVSAEMDRTAVVYSLRPTGGYVAKVTLGNFILSDADSVDNKTLYREIVGLKTDAPLDRGKPASLLEMSIVKNPRSRRFVSGQIAEHQAGKGNEESVTIDVSTASVRGCDIFFSAQFSPMRFVYLQQLWFEVIDYFFEGITGYEVWGNRRPAPIPPSELQFAPMNAGAFAFTRFDILLEAPVILIPVSYCSTDFLRVETDQITVWNRYDFRALRTETQDAEHESEHPQLQWFNNCSIVIENMTLSSWSGRRLNSSDDRFSACVDMNWPSGPTAILNKPKWKVFCKFDQAHMSLLREDYALIQHIVASNFSEGSRHWDEWDALQNLPPLVLERYKEDIMVHFGYDKKDVTPTTFDVSLTLPGVAISLLHSDRSETALIQCHDFTWKYWKYSDLISRQHIVCQVDIARRGEALLSGQDSLLIGDQRESPRPSLAYKSTARLYGDVERSIEIEQALFHVGYESWNKVAGFFRDLPAPSYISPEHVIQVGDRWYKIGGGSSSTTVKPENCRNLSWITAKKTRNDAPSQQQQQNGTARSVLFRIGLRYPQIALKSNDMALVLTMDTAEYSSFEKLSKIKKDCVTSNMQLTASHKDRNSDSALLPLLELASISARTSHCTAGEQCSCNSHSTIIEVGAIKSALTFSDISVACEVLLKIYRDIGIIKNQSKKVDSTPGNGSFKRLPSYPVTESILQLRCDSIDAVIVDDRRQRFAASQELLGIAVCSISFDRRQARFIHSVANSVDQFEESTSLFIQRVECVDCLQSKDSPFRFVLTATARDDPGLSFPFGETVTEVGQTATPCAIVLKRVVDREECRYNIDVYILALQYNPSMILALYRVMTQFWTRFQTAYRRFPPLRPPSSQNEISTGEFRRELRFSARLRTFSLLLNKEHEERSLIQIQVDDAHVTGRRSKTSSEVSAKVEDFHIVDADSHRKIEVSDRNKCLLKVSDVESPFLALNYMSFEKGSPRNIPDWSASFVRDQNVDTMLDICIASLDMVYLSQRTFELMDYLKKALPPGKSSSAPGLSQKARIRSCLSFRADCVNLYVPRNPGVDSGLVFIGDFLVRSWSSPDPLLEVEGSITDFCCKVYGQVVDVIEGNKVLENIDVLLYTQKMADGRMEVKCGVSDVLARICYTDYVHTMRVIRENIKLHGNSTQWKEVGFDWERDDADEEGENESTLISVSPSKSGESVPSGRLVGFGENTSKNLSATSAGAIEVTFALSDVSIILRRNDVGPESFVEYDMVLFRGEQFDLAVTSSKEGETASFSVKRMFAFDLGEQGRVLRSTRSYSGAEVGPMPIAILIEDYSSPEQTPRSEENGEDSLVMVRLDRPKINSADTKISIVVSRLSLAALFRPLQEITEFIGEAWSKPEEGLLLEQQESPNQQDRDLEVKEDLPRRSLALRFVLHYPRIMFVADEGDPHSRSLILRGLALVNARLADKLENEDVAPGNSGKISLVAVSGDFQGISSYIIPDVADILYANDSYRMHIEDVLLETAPYLFLEDIDSTVNQEEPGISLLLPVTVAVEFEQKSKDSVLCQRSVALNMDPVSLMINAEDLQLIRLLSKKWASRKGRGALPGKSIYNVVFHSQRLGLGLRKVGATIIVDAIHEQAIGIGDSLIAIAGEDLVVTESSHLSDIVERLRNEPRPLKLTFRAKKEAADEAVASHLAGKHGERSNGYKESADISLAQASLTLIGNDVPIFRGIISTTRLSASRTNGTVLERQLSFSSIVAIDYYNLKIWGWEPFMETANFKVSADMTDPVEGSKTLTLEVSDGLSSPMCFNVTDAFGSALRKLLAWDISPGYETDGTLFVEEAKKAANAALRFAKQQKNSGSKPFILQNRSGISCAFVIQKKSMVHNEVNKASHKGSFVAIGDYSGLQSYDPSEVSEVPSGGECKFRLDRGSGTRQKDGQGRVPCLTVAFQSVSGVVLEPLVDLQIVRSGVTLLPMSCFGDHGSDQPTNKTVWVSWTVDPRDEMTVLVLSSTFRIISLLNTQLELGLESKEPGNAVRSLGVLPAKNDFYLPIWLCLQKSFDLAIRPSGGAGFSPLFSFEDRNGGGDHYHQIKYVECISRGGGSTFLAASKDGDSASTSITIDCVLTLLNMLPVDIYWEVSKSLDSGEIPIDGSTNRRVPLGSGESAEIMGAGDLDIYVRVKRHQWSPWLSLETGIVKAEDIRVIPLTDVFGVPFYIGARIARKAVGFRVTLYSELWFLNTTSLDIAFGVSGECVRGPEASLKDDFRDEFSAAEAALKEISSLFETGNSGRGIQNQGDHSARISSMLLLPSNAGSIVVEECFEYAEVYQGTVIRRWWASSDPLSTMPNLTLIKGDGDDWSWIDPSWAVDSSGGTSEGWETAPSIFAFSPKRLCNHSHPYRRRRWYRRRKGPKKLVNAFFQRPYAYNPDEDRGGKREKKDRKRKKTMDLGIQVNGGEWSLLSKIPVKGVLYGAIRANSCRWKYATNRAFSTYELCYNVSPLEGEWGDMSRLMTISSRFILRNDSKNLTFEVKQAGADDSTAITVPMGGTVPFHWVNNLLPELISIRPLVEKEGIAFYRWSGGFDPLSIGVIPLRIRKTFANSDASVGSYDTRIRSIKLESKIRPGTGRTGINLSLEEEDERADGCLFRIDNRSLFPLWISQDGILVNPSRPDSSDDVAAGDCLPPSETISFALDVPFRQGKYKRRKAATLEELLRVRIALGPLHSRSGIESIRVVSLSTVGSTVRLNPSKLPALQQKHRDGLQHIRVVGVVTNDGPTRVLRLVMMRKGERLFSNPFNDDSSLGSLAGQSRNGQDPAEMAIVAGAEAAIEAFASGESFPLQDEALRMAMNVIDTRAVAGKLFPDKTDKGVVGGNNDDDSDRGVLVSFRMAFNGFIFSMVDSSPSEIAVVTLKNLNALASWNTTRTCDSTVYVTIAHFQVDNMLPNSPYPVAISPDEQKSDGEESGTDANSSTPPLLVLGLSFGPLHKSGIPILKSVTVAPRNVAIRVDLAFLVRLQKYILDLQRHFVKDNAKDKVLALPDLKKIEDMLIAGEFSEVNSQKFYFGGLTILPCTIKLSVAPARALSTQQAMLEGEESAAIHRAVRKGDVKIGDSQALLGVKIGSRNATPLAVMRGVVKSIVVDALLRLDGASLTFAGVSLQNHIATTQQLGSILAAHYLASLRHNVPALVGSMSALGNPVGLVRGLGDGVSDFVLEPVRGFQRSLEEMDASYLVDGVARGTLSLARHTVGGFADSAAALAETFSKNMAVLTLDRRYAQKRDREENLRELNDLNVALGLGSGFQKLAQGFVEGVLGVVKAPIRGAEKKGLEGFAKGVGKGLLGLLVKPIIGISDGFTDVMIGVKGAVDGTVNVPAFAQIRPRRALYGRERAIRPYSMTDAAASALMMRTRLAGELYMSHVDMGDRVALFSVKRMLMLGPGGQEMLVLKYRHIESWEIRSITLADGGAGWGIIIILNTPRRNGSEVEVINCKEKSLAEEMCSHLESGMRLLSSDLEILAEKGELTSSDLSRA